MAERKSKRSLVFIDDNEYDAITEPVHSTISDTFDSITKGNYIVSDFGSDSKTLVSNIVRPTYENSGLPVDVSDLGIENFFDSITTPGSAQHTGTVGFKDPADVWPTEFREGESDWHRFTGRPPDKIEENQLNSVTSIPPEEQNEYEETHIQTRNESRVGIINTVCTAAGPEWKEPESDKKTKYGDTWVWASPGGVTMEMDSTIGGQAYRITHPSNSFMEINSSGEFIQKTFASRYDIIAKDHYTYINDNRLTNIHLNDDLRIQGEQAIVVDKNKTEINRMDSSLTIFKSYVRNVGEDDALIVGKNQTITIIQTQDITIGMNKKEIIGLDYELFATTSIDISVGTNINFKAPGMFKVKAGIIYLN